MGWTINEEVVVGTMFAFHTGACSIFSAWKIEYFGSLFLSLTQHFHSVGSLMVVVDKTCKLSEILRRDIWQASPAMKYNDSRIESAKSKGSRSVKAWLQHPISVLLASCKNDDPFELEVNALFQKPYPKDAFSTMIADLNPNRTIMTLIFFLFEVFHSFRLHTIMQKTKNIFWKPMPLHQGRMNGSFLKFYKSWCAWRMLYLLSRSMILSFPFIYVL